MIRKDVFKDCGLFDTKFEKMRMGDNEFGTRCYLNGINIISNPKAKRTHLKTEVGGLRTFGHWDGLRTFKFLNLGQYQVFFIYLENIGAIILLYFTCYKLCLFHYHLTNIRENLWAFIKLIYFNYFFYR